LEGKLPHACRDTALAPLALDNELLAFLDSECHDRTRIGEYKAKIQQLFSIAGKTSEKNASATSKLPGEVSGDVN
jgi:hypothetical protein